MSARWQVFLAAALAMVAFASNSLLNRFALDDGSIDAASFAAIRIAAGAVTLAALVAVGRRPAPTRPRRAVALSALALFAYAAAFSFAYLRLGAGTGALLLFGVVQAVMYGHAVTHGERPGPLGWAGLGVAFAGVVALVAPGVSAPDPVGALLMAVAGVAWAVYTLRGRLATDPLAVTAGNFLWAVPLAVGLELVALLVGRVREAGPVVHVDAKGLALAVLSGAVTSGLGYALWYAVVPRLRGVQAGIIQLAPAPLAVLGGLLLLGEPVTWRVVLASLLVVIGVATGLLAPQRARRAPRTPTSAAAASSPD